MEKLKDELEQFHVKRRLKIKEFKMVWIYGMDSRG